MGRGGEGGDGVFGVGGLFDSSLPTTVAGGTQAGGDGARGVAVGGVAVVKVTGFTVAVPDTTLVGRRI